MLTDNPNKNRCRYSREVNVSPLIGVEKINAEKIDIEGIDAEKNSDGICL